MTRLFSLIVLCAASFAFVHGASSQDMTRNVDLSSPMYSTAEMTRADIEKALASGQKPDLSLKSLNGLDLSGLDLSGVNFRAARMIKTNFAGAKLTHAIFDQAWAIGANFSATDLMKASFFAAQMQETNFDDANLASARIAGDFSRAHLRRANFAGADLSADMKNQSMGLMRVVFRSADLEGANFHVANLARADLQFAKFKGANLTDANLAGAEAGGADFRGALLTGADLTGCDVTSARVDAASIEAFAKADHLDRVMKE